ncbi:MAG: TetR/AcrR family transcriptional regulator [Candidatus Atribacteria bacterium]|nr:TetR/AcrR family transcriptional regulator [Candidatus Atribacteria bacterium]
MTKNKNKLTKRKILITARRYFFTIGYSKVTMDEMALELHISKKTIYQLFKSKQFLLESVIYDFFQELHEKIKQIIENHCNNQSNVLKQFMSSVQSQISQWNMKAFEEISKNNPRAWSIITHLREKMIHNELRDLLQEGKKEGTIRKNIDLDIIVLIILNTVQSIAIPEITSQFPYSTEEVIEMIAKIIMHGIIEPEI